MNWRYSSAICALSVGAYLWLSPPASTQSRSGRSTLARPLSESFSSDSPQDSALLLAADIGDLDQVKHLLRTGASVNAEQRYPHFYPGWTPICFATIQSNLGMVQLLLQHHATVKPCGLPVSTVRNPEIVDLLLLNGADPNEGRNNGSRNTPLLLAASNWWADPTAYTTIIDSLLKYGADVNARDSSGKTALLYIHSSPFTSLPGKNPGTDKTATAPQYFAQVVKLLVGHGANVDDTQVEDFDESCCSVPDYRDGAPYCHILSPPACNLMAQYAPCESGRLVHFDWGTTPLMQAVENNNKILANSLLAAGADASRKDREGHSVMDLAKTEEMKLLLRTGPVSDNRPLLTESGKQKPMPQITGSNTPTPMQNRSTLDRPDVLETDVQRNEFICYQGPNRRAAVKQSAGSSFGNEKLLDVVIEDKTPLMGSDSQGVLANEIANALVIWRRMCVECATANAAVLRIGGTVYIDPYLKSIMDTVNYGSDYEVQRRPALYTGGCSLTKPVTFATSNSTGIAGASTAPQAPPEQSKAVPGWPIDLSEGALSTRLGLRVPLVPYTKVTASDPGVYRLCAAPYAPLPDILKGARAAFDCVADAQLPHASRASLKIKIVDGYTSCGRDDNIVGCESNEFLLELNASRYKFVDHGAARRLLFGHGNLSVDLQVVLLHELGHWTGIQEHLTSPHNIMSAYLSEAHCIDEAVVIALASVTESPVAGVKGRPLYYQRPRSRPGQSASQLANPS